MEINFLQTLYGSFVGEVLPESAVEVSLGKAFYKNKKTGSCTLTSEFSLQSIGDQPSVILNRGIILFSYRAKEEEWAHSIEPRNEEKLNYPTWFLCEEGSYVGDLRAEKLSTLVFDLSEHRKDRLSVRTKDFTLFSYLANRFKALPTVANLWHDDIDDLDCNNCLTR